MRNIHTSKGYLVDERMEVDHQKEDEHPKRVISRILFFSQPWMITKSLIRICVLILRRDSNRPTMRALIVLHFRLPSRTLIAMQDKTKFRCTLKCRLVQGHLRRPKSANGCLEFGITGICHTAFRTCFHFALLIIGA